MAKKTTNTRTVDQALAHVNTQVAKTNVLIDVSKDAGKLARNSVEGKAAKEASKVAQKSLGLSICSAISAEAQFGIMAGQTKEALAAKDAFNEAFAKLDVGEDTLRVYRRIVCCPAIHAHVPANATPAKTRDALAKVEWVNAKGKTVVGVGETPSQMRKFVEAHTAEKKYGDGVVAYTIKLLGQMRDDNDGMWLHLDDSDIRIDSPVGRALLDAVQLGVDTHADELDAGNVELDAELPPVNLGNASDDNRHAASS